MTADLDRAATGRVFADVLAERERQQAKWGTQRHEPTVWLAILVEEVGEAAQAMLPGTASGIDLAHLREELIQVAAVAVAIVEHVDEVTADA